VSHCLTQAVFKEEKKEVVDGASTQRLRGGLSVALVVAVFMADGQIFKVTVATLAQRLNVLQGGCFVWHMLTTHPARYHAVHLAGDSFVNLFTGEG
jgi:hypothetical protein